MASTYEAGVVERLSILTFIPWLNSLEVRIPLIFLCDYVCVFKQKNNKPFCHLEKWNSRNLRDLHGGFSICLVFGSNEYWLHRQQEYSAETHVETWVHVQEKPD